MRMNKIIHHINHNPLLLILALIGLVTGCTEEYNPDLGDASDLLVIDGSIVKGDTIQTVSISRSTSIYDISFIPVKGCDVWVENSNGQTFWFAEVESGVYQCSIPEEQLAYNTTYTLHVYTLDGEEYISTTETILESSPIDSVYYEMGSYSSSSASYDNGAQFYIDLKAPDENTRNYQWEVNETWEYRSAYEIAGYWNYETLTFTDWFLSDGSNIPRDTFMYCYQTRDIAEVYTSSTQNLTVNEKKKIPLHYVPVETRKLQYNYSVLVKQYALSDKAYVYWNQNMVQSSSSGGLYQTQPSQTRSNIVNVNNADEKILGYFWASSYTQLRIVLDRNYFHSKLSCVVDTLQEGAIDLEYSAYIAFIGYDLYQKKIIGSTSNTCLDCRLLGGTVVKPEFFKDE